MYMDTVCTYMQRVKATYWMRYRHAFLQVGPFTLRP